jgi:Uma2 family endonuclease
MATEPVRHRFTVDEFLAMDESGLFAPDQRLELIDGEVIEMAPIGTRHAAAVARLSMLFSVVLVQRAIVWAQSPIRLDGFNLPQPDVVLVGWRADFYRDRHPGPEDVVLVVEVSDSSRRWDRGVKRPRYAAAGIPEMWLVDLVAGVVEVARSPAPGGYGTVEALGRGETVAPGAFPELAVAVSDLVG